jgi:hypothetical protein
MPQYSLRTLIVVMLLAGPALAGAWLTWGRAEQWWRLRTIPPIQEPIGYPIYTPVAVQDEQAQVD